MAPSLEILSEEAFSFIVKGIESGDLPDSIWQHLLDRRGFIDFGWEKRYRSERFDATQRTVTFLEQLGVLDAIDIDNHRFYVAQGEELDARIGPRGDANYVEHKKSNESLRNELYLTRAYANWDPGHRAVLDKELGKRIIVDEIEGVLTHENGRIFHLARVPHYSRVNKEVRLNPHIMQREIPGLIAIPGLISEGYITPSGTPMGGYFASFESEWPDSGETARSWDAILTAARCTNVHPDPIVRMPS